MDKKTETASLIIESSLACVSKVSDFFSLFCKQHGIENDISFQLELCVVEAVNNAIIHAYQNNSGQIVLISCLLIDKELTIKISDQGVKMKQPIPVHLVAPEFESGRGWYIMQQWTDSVKYISEHGTNTVFLQKKIAAL